MDAEQSRRRRNGRGPRSVRVYRRARRRARFRESLVELGPHSRQVTLADGTPEGEVRVTTVLRNDPALGIIRHADAGYERAVEVAEERGVKIPMINMDG